MRSMFSTRLALSVVSAIAVFLFGGFIWQIPQSTITATLSSQPVLARVDQEKASARRLILQHSPKRIPELQMVRLEKLESEDWLNEFEVEYKNVSDKPIYYISIYLILDETEPYYGKTHFKMVFGNYELAGRARLATPEDPALKPGESHVFKIPKAQIKALKKELMETTGQESFLLPVTKVVLDLYNVEFGDGTGYTAGELLPRKKKLLMLCLG